MALYLAIERSLRSQHGKEGVRGSSPRVGFVVIPLQQTRNPAPANAFGTVAGLSRQSWGQNRHGSPVASW